MTWRDFDQNSILMNLWGEMQRGFGELKEGQIQNRMASEARTKDLHKRIDRVEDKIERMRETKPTALFSKAFGLILSHPQPFLWLIVMGLGFLGVKNPEAIKSLIASIK